MSEDQSMKHHCFPCHQRARNYTVNVRYYSKESAPISPY